MDESENRKTAILHKAFSGELSDGSDIDDINKMYNLLLQERERQIAKKLIKRARVTEVDSKSIIKGISNEWKQVKIGEIAFVTKLAGFEYTKYIELKEQGDVPVVRAQNVRKGYLDTTNLLFIDKEISNILERSALTKESLLVTFIGAGIGDVCVFDEKQRFHLAPNVAKVEFFGDGIINIEFMLYYLLSHFGQQEIFKNMKATAQPSLSMETIRDIIVPLPSREKQDSIVRILKEIISKEDEVMYIARGVMEKIEIQKKSILTKAFRCELGTNSSNEESAVELLKSILEQED